MTQYYPFEAFVAIGNGTDDTIHLPLRIPPNVLPGASLISLTINAVGTNTSAVNAIRYVMVLRKNVGTSGDTGQTDVVPLQDGWYRRAPHGLITGSAGTVTNNEVGEVWRGEEPIENQTSEAQVYFAIKDGLGATMRVRAVVRTP